MFDGLDDLSKLTAERFLARWPEWQASTLVDEYDGESFLIIDVPNPHRSDRGMRISTLRGEITVFIDAWHAHFDGWDEGTDDETVVEAIEYLELILADRVVFAVEMEGDQWRGSSAVDAEELPERLERMKEGYVFSWTGRFDAEVPPKRGE